MEFAASAHAADDALVVHLGVIEQKHFGCHRVDGIHHIVKGLRHEVDDGLVFQVLVEDGQLYFGVDVTQTLGHHLCLRSANGAFQGQQLSVTVGHVHHVAVDDGHAADTRTGQLLGSVCTHATQSNHKHVLGFQGLDAFIANQQAGSILPVFHRFRF